MPERVCCALVCFLALGLLACGEVYDAGDPGEPPYGFGFDPLQRFRFEARDETDVGGTPVTVERGAEIEVTSSSAPEGRHELVVALVRYVSRVEGIPGGSSEFTLSEEGLTTRGPRDPEPLRLGPDDEAPLGGRIADVLLQPLGGWLSTSDGVLEGTPWRSQQPLFGGIRLVDWLLLSLPVLAESERESWSGTRPVPPLGQYVLGIDLPIDYQRVADPAAGLERVRAQGKVRRTGLAIAKDFRGLLELEFLGEADFDLERRVMETRIELRVNFEADQGEVVRSRHLARFRCVSCGG